MKKNQCIRKTALCSALLFSALLISCGKSESAAELETGGTVPRMANTNLTVRSAKQTKSDAKTRLYDAPSDGVMLQAENVTPPTEGVSSPGTVPQEKKLVKTGFVMLEVQSLSEANTAVESWSSSFGGYISNSYSNQMNASYTVKIPASHFDEAMKTVGDFGILREHSVSTQDVSEQFYDLETRLSNKKVMRENLQKYLSQAKDIKDMLQIEKELTAVLSEIESMEGSIKRLSNQIDYATITVSVQLPYGKDETGWSFPDMGEGFRKFVSNTVSFFARCFTCFFYIIVCGIPILAIVGFLYWLLWGKIGLLKKLYHRLSK